MRTRKEIEEEKNKLIGTAFASQNLSLEVLLDIRDILYDININGVVTL